MSSTVSVAFSSYNQAPFVEQALLSVLGQDHPEFQVVVYDDGSDDGTQAAIRDVVDRYEGPHEIVVQLQEHNAPYQALRAVMERCDGEYIVRAHGDDVSHPGRVSRLLAEAERLGVSMVVSNAVVIDADDEPIRYWREPDGESDCSLANFARTGLIDAEFGAGLSYERRVWDEFGPLHKGPRNSDGVLALRAALLDGAHFDREPTLLYRQRAGQGALWAQAKSATDDRERIRIQERNLQNRVANAVAYVELVQDHLGRHPGDKDAQEALSGFIGNLFRKARDHSHARADLALTDDWRF